MSQIYKNCYYLLFTTILVLSATALEATNVPVEEAKKVAITAFASKSVTKERSAKDLKITDTYTQMLGDKPAYYIFNIEPKGFIIISAEDDYNTVLGFSDESRLQLDNTERMSFIYGNLHEHEQRIEYIRTHDYKPAPEVSQEWDRFRSSSVEVFSGRSPEGMVIPPLTTTTWNQGKYYNAYTPVDNVDPEAPDGRTFCGCAPIAMAQMIKYHNYPATGNGAIKYEDPDYGEQAVDFCRPYDWNAMPDSLTDYNDDVSEFIYHVGASTQTFYSTVYTETYISYMRDAMVNFWNYDSAASWFLDRDNEFADVAISDLNKGRPVVLTGQAWNNGVFGGAHTWIADGYGYSPSTGDPFFHFNWGWGGDNDGWFLDATGSWAPIPFSSGIRPITYYWERYVIHNIFPAEENCGAPNYIYINSVSPFRASFASDYVTEYEKTINFRYRKVGSNDWVELPTTTTYYSGTQVLEPETDYEVQVRKQCCEGSWSKYSQSEFFTTPEYVNVNPCETLRSSKLTTSSITETNAYIYTSQPYGKVNNQFRYRFKGALLWSYSDISSNYYRYLSNLEPGTEYEYQIRHTCAQGEWTEYSASATFTTEGQVTTCTVTYPLDLFTSSTTEKNTYIYTTQPYGKVLNDFRYKPVGSTDWTTTSTDDNYYRFLSGLTLGTEYEFQVRHQCDGVNYTDWSTSAHFTTLGGVMDCDAINGDILYTSSISKSNAYVYTPQPYGQVANQFRYRVTGTTTWTNSTVSTLYYRYLSNLQAGKTYEFQTSHECAISSWSPWSSSKTFTTLNAFGGGGSVGKILPPYEDAGFDPVLFVELEAKVYPNPATDIVSFESNEQFTEDSMLKLIDLSGQVVREVILPVGEREKTIDLEQLASGLYVIHYSNGYNTTIEKIIKR